MLRSIDAFTSLLQWGRSPWVAGTCIELYHYPTVLWDVKIGLSKLIMRFHDFLIMMFNLHFDRNFAFYIQYIPSRDLHEIQNIDLSAFFDHVVVTNDNIYLNTIHRKHRFSKTYTYRSQSFDQDLQLIPTRDFASDPQHILSCDPWEINRA